MSDTITSDSPPLSQLDTEPAEVKPTEEAKWEESASHVDSENPFDDPFTQSQPNSGAISLSNPWADSDKWEADDSWNPFATDVKESDVKESAEESLVLQQVRRLTKLKYICVIHCMR